MKNAPPTALAVCFASALSLAAPAALAQSPVSAKTLFNIGAQAFATQRYDEAILAFEKAYAVSPRPGIRFSLAQAHRRRYGKTQNLDDAKRALELFRAYVAEQKTGGRVDDALTAIGELEAIVGMAAPKGETPAPEAVAPKPAPKNETMLMIGASQSDAMISLDGGPAVAAPLLKVVAPGDHKVRVTAPGFAPEERTVPAVANQTLAYDVPLRELPAALDVQVDSGAQVTIDGRFVGSAPFPKPLEVAPGRHLVVVGKTGHQPIAHELNFTRGRTRKMTVDLATTGQRKASYALVGGGFVGVAVGAVMAIGAASKQRTAKELQAEQEAGTLTRAESFNDAVASRDRFRAGAVVSFGVGAALGLGGLLAYAFDAPDMTGANPKSEPAPKPKLEPERAPAMPMEMGALPLVGPGFAGAALRARF